MIKRWLAANKVYFEVTSSLLFGFAALLVSLASYNVSLRQHELSIQQTKPVFQVIYRESETEDYQEISMFNVGRPARNLEITLRTFMGVREFRSASAPKTYQALIPVQHYYDDYGSRPDKPSKQLMRFRGRRGNKQRFYEFSKAFHQQVAGTDRYMVLYPEELIVFAYVGHDGAQTSEFYWGDKRVCEQQGQRLLNLSKQDPLSMLELDIGEFDRRLQAAEKYYDERFPYC